MELLEGIGILIEFIYEFIFEKAFNRDINLKKRLSYLIIFVSAMM